MADSWEADKQFIFGMTVKECMKLWKKIRDKYVKILKPLPSGTDAENAEKLTSWELFPFLHFLKHCVKRRITKSNIKPNEVKFTIEEEENMSSNSQLVRNSQPSDSKLVRDSQPSDSKLVRDSQLSASQLLDCQLLDSQLGNEVDEDGNPEVPQDKEPELECTTTPRIIAPSSNTKKKRKIPDEFEFRILESLGKRKQPPPQLPNANQQFLNSLLPYLEELSPKECSIAKLKMLTLLHQMKYNVGQRDRLSTT